jgi:hypothetical protein
LTDNPAPLAWANGAAQLPSVLGQVPFGKMIEIDYTNWRGERSSRRIVPTSARFGSSEYHPGPGWLVEAYDADKDAERTFAWDGVHSWTSIEDSGGSGSFA